MSTVTVGDLIDEGFASIQTGPFGTQLKAAEYTDKGRPLLNVKNVGFGEVRVEGLVFVSDETAERLRAHILKVEDIVFGRKGAVERHAFIPAAFAGAVQGSDCIRLRLDRRRILPRFASFALRTEAHRVWMQNQSSHGATMASLNQGIVRRIEIPALPLDAQTAVVRILGAIDDLIENNRRRIALLEQMAQAIYREWFVHFRYPGHEDEELVDSPLGLIPTGWEVTTLAEHATALVDGDWIETKDQGGNDYRLLQVSNIGVGSFRETGNFRYITTDTFERLRCTEIRPGDILISRMPDPVGRAWLVDAVDCPAVTAVDVAILTPRSPQSGLFLSHWLNTPEALARAEAVATGTTRKRITRSVLGGFDLGLPAERHLSRFFGIVEPMAEAASNLRRESLMLAAARDLLLPKLVTGAIDVSHLDLDALLEEPAA